MSPSQVDPAFSVGGKDAAATVGATSPSRQDYGFRRVAGTPGRVYDGTPLRAQSGFSNLMHVGRDVRIRRAVEYRAR